MKKVILISFLMAIAMVSCEKFGVKNISKKTVVLLAPTNNSSDSILTKFFWWEEVDGADQYHIQIVSTSFDNIVSLVLDSVTTKEKLSVKLSPGTYQWRVRGENGSYETEWTTYNLTVTNTMSLNGQTVTGLLPINLKDTNSLMVTFRWDAFPHATSYLFTIINADNAAIVKTDYSTTNSYQYTFAAEGRYHWKVQGINTISASNESTTYIGIDLTPPLTTLISPGSITDTVKTWPHTFTWSHGASIAPITDSLFLSTDSTFATTVHAAYVISPDITSYNVVDSPHVAAGKMWWRIRPVDAAGNVGAYTIPKKFYKK